MHLDGLDPLGCSQPEVDPGIAGGLVTSTAEPLRDLFPPAGSDCDDGPDPIAVRFRTLQLKSEVVPCGRHGAIVEIDRRLVVGDHERVDSSVVVEITHGQPAADVKLLERRSGQ